MQRLYMNRLPVSAEALDTTRKILLLERSAKGAVLSGKTGTQAAAIGPLGWFVGHLVTADAEPYLLALLIKEPPPRGQFAGPWAKQLAIERLVALGKY